MKTLALVAALLLLSCKPNNQAKPVATIAATQSATSPALPALTNTTVNQFILRGPPTFVLGTTGDVRADNAIAAQVSLVRALFASSLVVNDDSIDVSKGPTAWPVNPVLYGGPQVSSVMKALAPILPLQLEPGKLVIGEQIFTGDDYRLITVIPARAPDRQGPGYPEFLLYAGTGTPGIAEINAVTHGPDPIVIADLFGTLLKGHWRQDETGKLTAEFVAPRARRIEWRVVERPLPGIDDSTSSTVKLQFPGMLPPAPDEAAVIDACMRGLTRAVNKLQLKTPANISVYVYPDRRSKKSLTGDEGDGHAVISARALHVLLVDTSVGGGMESLVAHEGTHLLAYEAWGPSGSSLFGEGLAVWVSGQYGGVPLADWAPQIKVSMSLLELLGPGFRKKLSEKESYPIGGLFVGAVIKQVGIERVRDYLFDATADTWEAACQRAGTSPTQLEEVLRALSAPAKQP
jgi:hypothetical protein